MTILQAWRRLPCALTLAALSLCGTVTADAAAQGGAPRRTLEANTTMAAPSSTPARTQQSSADRRPVIACFGDSLTAGYGVGAEESYPSRLQRYLDESSYHYRVVNMGVSGETTKDGLTRVDRVIALKPAIAVVEFGGNDGLRGLPIASSRANLDEIVTRLQAAHISVALAGITLPPQFSAPYVRQFNETYVLVSRRHGIPLYPFLLKDVYGVEGSIQQDGIHPTAKGCQQVARNVLGFLRPLLKRSNAA